ncbi:MAG: polyketide synthase dehydratase domain-containing protein [Pseudonocardiaceae bacterium]
MSGKRCPGTVSHSRACAVTAQALYRDRWMFHGPAFQGVTGIGPLSEDGITGELTVPAAPGALLDNAGQLLGFWIMMQAARDRLAFPATIGEIRYFGPPPAPGHRVRCDVRISALTPTSVTANLELCHPGGQLWARIDGWTDRRFNTDELTWPVFVHPERNAIAQRQPGGWYLARDRWPDPATRELIMRRYLTTAERTDYQQRNPRAAQQWLLGRIVAKDAVRHWLWDSGTGPIFPIEITVSTDTTGRLHVTGPFDELLQVSLAQEGTLAAALVGPPGRTLAGPAIDMDIDIDIEQITDPNERTLATILQGRTSDDRRPDPG